MLGSGIYIFKMLYKHKIAHYPVPQRAMANSLLFVLIVCVSFYGSNSFFYLAISYE